MKAFERFLSIFHARNKEFLRDRGGLAWNFIFPLFLLIGFSFTFQRDAPQDQVLIGVTGQAQQQWQQKIDALPYVKALIFEDREQALEKLKHHKFDLLLDTTPNPPVYYASKTAPKAYVAEQLVIGVLERQNHQGPPHFERQSIASTEVPYLDWFFPGLLGMNVMFSAIFGVGYVIVRYRKNGVLKRLSTTPLTAFEFLAAQLCSRLCLTLSTSFIICVVSILLFGFQITGSYTALMAVFFCGAAALVSMGLLVAARTESEELAGGLLNMMSWPMMIFSEVWFSLESSPVWLQKLALIFPLTHLVQGARAIMNDGAGWAEVSHHLVFLTVMTFVFLSIGARLFRWNRP